VKEIADLDRVVIVGTPAAGKSTLARVLAECVGAPRMELDGFFHGPDWQPVPEDEFHARLRDVAAMPRWVVDGTFLRHTAPIIWPRAQLIVWLDLPLAVVMSRLVRRTVGRIMRRTPLWNGNRETWRKFLSRESILLHGVESHRRYRRELPGMLSADVLPSVRVVRLTSRREVESWSQSLRT
jgi:adenylate kinase family enzyme